MKSRTGYISLYIKRLFTKDFKKQLFLIIGIAAFMTSLSRRVILSDSEQGYRKNMVEEEQWGFTHKIYDVSDEMTQYLETQEEIERVDILEKVALKSGINHADWIAPVNLPERWGMAGVEPEYEWGEVLAYTMLTVLLGGACLGAIIYVVLKDEKRNVGILRALGAKKRRLQRYFPCVFWFPAALVLRWEAVCSFCYGNWKKRLYMWKMLPKSMRGW